MFRILLMKKGYKQTSSLSIFHRVAYTICFSFHVLFEMLYLQMLLTIVKWHLIMEYVYFCLRLGRKHLHSKTMEDAQKPLADLKNDKFHKNFFKWIHETKGWKPLQGSIYNSKQYGNRNKQEKMNKAQIWPNPLFASTEILKDLNCYLQSSKLLMVVKLLPD